MSLRGWALLAVLIVMGAIAIVPFAMFIADQAKVFSAMD